MAKVATITLLKLAENVRLEHQTMINKHIIVRSKVSELSVL